MSPKFTAVVLAVLLGGAAAYFWKAKTPSPVSIGQPRYTCTMDPAGNWITRVDLGAESKILFQWVSEYFSDSGWPPEERCQEVSPKFQTASNNGMLNYLTNAEADNGLPILCANSSQETACDFMLFTLKPSDDPDTVRQLLIDWGEGAATGAIPQSGNYKVYIPFEQVLQNSPSF
ncbi:MAG: COP23 domain-containing protein [Prochlorothrix sp.]